MTSLCRFIYLQYESDKSMINLFKKFIIHEKIWEYIQKYPS